MDDLTLAAYAKKIYGFAYSKTHNVQDAEDLSQNILLDLFRIQKDPREIGDLDAYVYRVCRYAWSNFYRREKRYWQMCPEESLSDAPDGADTPEEAVLQKELYAVLRRKVMNLSHLRRQITTMFYFENKSGHDIASRLGISPATVRWHLSESRNIIKEQIEMENNLYTPRRLTVYFSGNANNGSLYGLRNDLMTQNICIACADHALTVEDICETIGVAAVYIEEKLADLCMMGYLKKNAGKYRTTFFIRDASFLSSQKQFEMQLFTPLADAIDTVITRHIGDIRALGFLGCDADETLLRWDFITAAAHDYMVEYSLPIHGTIPLRGDGSRHWIDASWSDQAIAEACGGMEEPLYDYIRYSGGCAGKFFGCDTAFLQQFDPPILTGYREFDTRTVEQLSSAVKQAREGVSENETERLMLTRIIELGMAKMRDGHVHMQIPCLTKAEFTAYQSLTQTVLLPEITAICGDGLAKSYYDFVYPRLPADLDRAEKEFAATRFYAPNAIPYLLYRAGKLPLPEDAHNTVCTMFFEHE